MRAILVLIGVAALVLVALMALGIVNIRQTGTASLPSVHVDGGQAPKFQADVGRVDVGTSNTTVRVPKLEMKDTTVKVPTVDVERAPNAPAAQ